MRPSLSLVVSVVVLAFATACFKKNSRGGPGGFPSGRGGQAQPNPSGGPIDPVGYIRLPQPKGRGASGMFLEPLGGWKHVQHPAGGGTTVTQVHVRIETSTLKRYDSQGNPIGPATGRTMRVVSLPADVWRTLATASYGCVAFDAVPGAEQLWQGAIPASPAMEFVLPLREPSGEPPMLYLISMTEAVNSPNEVCGGPNIQSGYAGILYAYHPKTRNGTEGKLQPAF